MKKLVFFLTCFILFSSLFAQSIVNNTYKSGENLRYIVSFGFLNAGRANLVVNERELNGKKYHYAIATGQSIGVVGKLYKVIDTYESIMDANTSMPVKAIRNISEDKYKLYEEVYYNRANNTIKSDRKGVVSVPDNTLCILSALYVARRFHFNNLKKGDVVKLNSWFDDNVYPLEIRYYGNETIKTKFGKINCLKFSPIVEPGRIFDSPDDVTIWISNDNNKVPVRIQFNLVIGSVKCDLDDYKNLKNNFAIL